jgi:hypothetical protein
MPFDEALQHAVESAPREAGQSSSSWTCREPASYLLQLGHPAVSDETVRRHLHAPGYAIVRPVLSSRSPDEQYAKKVEKLRLYKAAAKRSEVELLFEDDSSKVHLAPAYAIHTRRVIWPLLSQ